MTQTRSFSSARWSPVSDQNQGPERIYRIRALVLFSPIYPYYYQSERNRATTRAHSHHRAIAQGRICHEKLTTARCNICEKDTALHPAMPSVTYSQETSTETDTRLEVMRANLFLAVESASWRTRCFYFFVRNWRSTLLPGPRKTDSVMTLYADRSRAGRLLERVRR